MDRRRLLKKTGSGTIIATACCLKFRYCRHSFDLFEILSLFIVPAVVVVIMFVIYHLPIQFRVINTFQRFVILCEIIDMLVHEMSFSTAVCVSCGLLLAPVIVFIVCSKIERNRTIVMYRTKIRRQREKQRLIYKLNKMSQKLQKIAEETEEEMKKIKSNSINVEWL